MKLNPDHHSKSVIRRAASYNNYSRALSETMALDYNEWNDFI